MAPASSISRGERTHTWRSRRSRCRARAARRLRRHGARSRADARVPIISVRTPLTSQRRSSSVNRRRSSSSRRRRPCRTPRARCRVPGSTPPSTRGRRRQSRALADPGSVVHATVESPRSSGRSGARPPRHASFSTNTTDRSGCARRTARAWSRAPRASTDDKHVDPFHPCARYWVRFERCGLRLQP